MCADYTRSVQQKEERTGFRLNLHPFCRCRHHFICIACQKPENVSSVLPHCFTPHQLRREIQIISRCQHIFDDWESSPDAAPVCCSLYLAINTHDWTFTSKISAILGTHRKTPCCTLYLQHGIPFVYYLKSSVVWLCQTDSLLLCKFSTSWIKV